MSVATSSFKMRFNFSFHSKFSSNSIMEQWKHRDSDSFCDRNMSCFYQVLHHRPITCMTGYFYFYLFFSYSRWARSEATSDCRVVRSAAEYRRQRCRSVAQTSALLRGNERPSFGIFAVGLALQLELV